ncbi:MAG: LapA family protein [Leptolyngbyaceae cyanobacterium SL_7_1]|nr:LapA family protein [Leptolyngbyaceae cyanobacterium SL_7_1]
MTNLLTTFIVAFWIGFVALLSVQNAAPVALRFLFLQSVEMPLGLVLAFCVAIGMIGMALLLPALQGSRSRSR